MRLKIFLLACFVVITHGADDCHVVKEVDPGVQENGLCVFPFTYKGKTYSSCTNKDMENDDYKEWCSTKTDADGNHISNAGNWGICSKDCPRENICPEGWAHLKSGCYKTSSKIMDKFNAITYCQEVGGSLAEFSSKDELDDVNQWYKSQQGPCLFSTDGLWLGIHNDTDKNAWVTDSTGEVSFTHWLDTEPTHYLDDEKCAAIFANSHFSNYFELKEFGWFAINCGRTEWPVYGGWDATMKPLCRRNFKSEGSIPILSFEKEENNWAQDKSSGCFEGYTRVGESCYHFKHLPSTFREAKNYCESTGGFLAEIESEEEFKLVDGYWREVDPKMDQCDGQTRSWWIGLSDKKVEGKWVSEMSGKVPEFTKWHGDEPNNWGGKVPGEDCAFAHLWKDNFKWYDGPCNSMGFSHGSTEVSMNPLCEHKPFAEKPFEYEVDGSNQEWVSIGDEKYKFIKTEGVTRDEAEQICDENGGFLANIKSEEERSAIQEHYLKHETGQAKSYFLAALDFITGSKNGLKFAWWVGASDEEQEGTWKWKQTKSNVTDAMWFFFGRGLPGKPAYNDFGDDDCAMLLDINNLLSIKNWKENEYLRPRAEEEDKFKLMHLSCYARVYKEDEFNWIMNPLCQANNLGS